MSETIAGRFIVASSREHPFPMLELRTLTIERDRLKTELLPCLEGAVFHVTRATAFESILSSGWVFSNSDARFPFTFPQSSNAYGRRRGYVSLFDLRDISDDEVQEALDRFYFLDPFHERDDPVFLFLDPSAYTDLISWRTTRNDYSEMWIPFVESWYPGDISVAVLHHALRIKVERPPESEFEKILRLSRGDSLRSSRDGEC
jgi:hypothetical protein